MNHFYPGMGATSSMYGDLWKKEFEGQFHNWPTWQGERTLQDIAERIIKEHKIESGDTVIGTSLGGILACEIANQIDLKRIVLIGSAQSKEEINSILSAPHPKDANHTIDGGHLIVMTHPLECIQPIKEEQP